MMRAFLYKTRSISLFFSQNKFNSSMLYSATKLRTYHLNNILARMLTVIIYCLKF